MDLHNLNDMLDQIAGLGIETSQGTVVRIDDVRRLIIQREIAETPDNEVLDLRTWDQARHAAKAFLLSERDGPEPIQFGRSISASPSAVEGV